MVSLKSVDKQLKRIHFGHNAWNRAETMELPNILLADEVIYECVNGTYEGGFALLVATNVRLLLIDKKPLKFLTVEDLRFDMINQIDYSHRLFGARISVSAGSKNLKFMSYNQQRLRKLIGHVQHCMAEVKKEQSHNAVSQQQHLEQINQQLQAYLLAQHQQQEELRKQLEEAQSKVASGVPALGEPQPVVKPSPELSDFLYAQMLLQQYQSSQRQGDAPLLTPQAPTVSAPSLTPQDTTVASVADDTVPAAAEPHLADLYAAGMQEVFGRHESPSAKSHIPAIGNPLEINPLRIAYSKLPMALRDRAFARRSGMRHTPNAHQVPSAVTQNIVA